MAGFVPGRDDTTASCALAMKSFGSDSRMTVFHADASCFGNGPVT